MPAPLAYAALQGASLLGGLFGRKRKHIDPEYLRQTFGSRAVAQDAQDLANFLLNSPYGQQLMTNAAESGQNFQTEMAARAANSGLDPSSGGQSGAGDFATSAATQATNAFQRGVKGSVYQTALPIAADQVAARQNAYINDLNGGGYQDDRANLWGAIGNAAGFAASQVSPQPKAAPAGNAVVNPDAAAAAQAAYGNVNAVAPNGQRTILATRPNTAPAGTVDYGFGGALQPSPFARRLTARRLGMSRAMLGQGMVQPTQ